MVGTVRPYMTVSVALVGASVITVAPIQPPDEESRVSTDRYSLAAATTTDEACSGYFTDGCDIWADQSYTPVALDLDSGSVWNIPANIVNAIISIPRAYINALNDLSYSLEVTGSWWVYTETNVLGYDPADPPKITALINLLIPFEALSEPLGEQVSWWAKANLPMNAGCTGTAPPTCEDANAILSEMFQVPIWDLITGYTFPELNNPVSDAESAAGEEIDGEKGDEVPWSGESVQLNPWDPVYSVVNYLLADPAENTPEAVTLTEIVETVTRLGAALWEAFNPFVPGSFLWKGYPYTLVTDLIKPFVSILCPECDPEHPEDPTPFDGELPPSSEEGESDTTSVLVSATTADEDDPTAAEVTQGTTGQGPDVESESVQTLLAKFESAPQQADEDAATNGVDADRADEDADVVLESDVATETESDGQESATGTAPEIDPESSELSDEDETETADSDHDTSSEGSSADDEGGDTDTETATGDDDSSSSDTGSGADD